MKIHPVGAKWLHVDRWTDRQDEANSCSQWRTDGGGLGCSTPPPPNSEDIGGVLDRMSKKNRRFDFLL